MVPSALIKRVKSHFITIKGVDLVLGLNGYIHVGRILISLAGKHVELNPDLLNEPAGLYSNQNEDISNDERLRISRIANIITILAKERRVIEEELIVACYEASEALEYQVHQIVFVEAAQLIIQSALDRMTLQNQ